MRDLILDGMKFGTSRTQITSFYKVIDFKPYIQSDDWWGYVANDVIVENFGNATMSGFASIYTWGPF